MVRYLRLLLVQLRALLLAQLRVPHHAQLPVRLRPAPRDLSCLFLDFPDTLAVLPDACAGNPAPTRGAQNEVDACPN